MTDNTAETRKEPSTGTQPESATFAMSFTNTGVGPARMRGMRLVVDGKPIRDWAHAVTQLGGRLSDGVSRQQSRNALTSATLRFRVENMPHC